MIDTWGAEKYAPVHREGDQFIAISGRVSGSGANEKLARENLGRNLIGEVTGNNLKASQNGCLTDTSTHNPRP